MSFPRWLLAWLLVLLCGLACSSGAAFAQSGAALPSGFYHTNGNQIVSSSGVNVRLACVGYEPYINNPATDFPKMRAAGFNCVRPDVSDRDTCPGGVCNFSSTDAVVNAATAANMKVIFSHHSNEGNASSGNCSSQQANGIWYDVNSNTTVDGVQWNSLASNQNGCGDAGTVTYAQFKANSVAMAAHYAGNSTVIGWDLWNEPLYGHPLCGSACPTPDINWGGNNGTDIRLMYQSVGSAIEAAAPGVLIIAEGVINCTGTLMSGASASPATGCMQELSKAASNPVTITNSAGQSVVVYSTHDYPNDVSGQSPDSGASGVTARNNAWGFLVKNNTAPVWVGEGGSGCAAGAEAAWCAAIVAYSNGTASGGPTFSAGQQGLGMGWWFWGPPGSGITEIPGVCSNAACTTMLAQQQQYWSQMLYTPSATAPGQFSIVSGSIIDPNGNPYVANGINVDVSEMDLAFTNTAGQPFTTLFPHANFIRVPVRATSNIGSASATYPDPASFATFIQRATALGIVVELEDHSSNGGQWECFISGSLACTPSYPPTGGALTTMVNFWKSVATLYKNNPYVWIGSLNEINSGDGTYSTSAIAATTVYENALYTGIRSTGNNNIIEMGNGVGGGNAGTVGANSGQNSGAAAGLIANWHNVVWYMHGYYTDGTPNGALSYLTGSTAACCGGSGGSGYTAAQTLRSADGLVPVIVDECGSGTGNAGNGDGSSMVSALGGGSGLTGGVSATLRAKGIGFACWAWDPSTQWQMVNNGATPGGPFSLTTWGGQMANMIATWPGPTPPGSGPGPGGTFTESTDQTTVTTSGPSITDAVGNVFAISSSAQILINGTPDPTTANVVELAYVSHTLWQLNQAGNWYNYLGSPGSYGGPTTTSPLTGGGGSTPPPSGTVPVPAPLTGTVTPSSWQAFDSTYPGITLACGKPFHYVLAQPPQYNPTLYNYPLYIWLHPDHSGDSWYLGDNNPLKQAGNEAGSFNTQAFQTRHPGFYVAPSADQTNGNGSPGSCNSQADSAVKNWGGWFHTGSQAGSGTVYSGDTGPNTFAIIAMVNELKSKYSIDPGRIYVNGFSLGGIASDYLCYHYNAYNGDKGKVFAACAGSAGVNQADAPPSSAAISALRSVPQWQFSGTGDGASPPGSWNTPLCSGLGGNPSALTGITSATANQCGTSAMRYTLCPSCGHQDTDASGNPVWSNQIINDFIFAQSAATTTPPATGKFKVSGGKIIAPNGTVWKGVGINIADFRSGLDMANAVTNFTTGAPLTTLFPGINFVRIALYGGGSQSSPTAYPDPSSYDAFINTMTRLGIVVELEHHVATNGATGGGGQGVVPGLSDAWLIAENNNYAALAARYKDNPYVWFGTNNEPPSATGLSQWQQSTYNAIRNAGNTNPIMFEVWGSRPPGYGGTPLQQGMVQSIYSTMTNVIWDPHVYPFINGNNTSQASNNQTSLDMIAAAQTITSADGVMPVIIGEYGPSTTGSSSEANGTQTVAGVLNSGVSSAVWHWGMQDCCNNLNNGNTLTALGQQVAAAIAANVQPSAGETLTINTIPAVNQNTSFTVSGTISGVTAAPALQYSDNGTAWTALPAGSTVTATTFSFLHPGMAPNSAATVSVRDANNNSISTTGPPFIVKAPESANNTIAVPGTATSTPTFSDTFSTLSLHNTWQSGDKWQLVAPDTPAGRGGPNFGENGDQWWVNPFNTNTPISGIYVRDSAGLHLGLIGTPSAQQAYINAQAGAAMPYVGGLLNTSQTLYQKYGYWEIKVAVPKVNGFTFQADTENVQVTGTWPPEIDLRIGTNASGVQTVLFQFALGGGQYTQYTAPAGFDPTVMHTYAWDWEADFITFYIDNVQVFQAPNPGTAYQSNPMFMFLVTAANYIANTGDPSLGSLPVNATVQAVNVYPSRPGSPSGPSSTITDASGNTFFITTGRQISINGTVDGTTANVVELAYVNHVLWQLNQAGNWYNYLGTPGSYGGPTTTSPITGTTEALTVSTITSQVSNASFVVSGTISGVTSAPTLQYQDNSGAWTALPGDAVVGTSSFSFTHPALAAGQYVVTVRDTNATGITGASNTFSVAQASGETITVNPIGPQVANTPFTVSGTVSGAATSTVSTDFAYNPGQDGSFWKQPFQTSANWISSGSLINTLRSGTPSINTKGNYGVPWVVGTATDPVVKVTDNVRSINVHIPLGTIIETPTSPFDQSIGGTDKTQPYLVWSISGATMNTGSVQATGSVITGTYGFTIQDGAGLIMVDAVTGVPGSNNSIGGIQDYDLAKIQSDPNYVIPHMLAFQMDISQAAPGNPGTLAWPLAQGDGGATYTGPIPQGITIGIPANVQMPAGKSRAYKALWDQLQQFGMFNYNFGATGGVNFVVYSQSGAYSSLIADLQAAWADIGKNYISILNYNSGVSGAQYSLATTKGAIAGSTNAFPAPPPLDLSATGGINVAPNTFGAWYPNTAYTAVPTNPGALATAPPTLQYQIGSGPWTALPSDATVTGTTYSFTVPGMSATSAGKISVRDANNTAAVGVSNIFTVSSTAIETLAISTIPTQQANIGFTVAGSITNATSAPTLQYQDNGGAWQAFPAGSTVSTTAFSFPHPGMAASASAVIAIRDAGATTIVTSSNAFVVQLAESANNTIVTTVGPTIVDATGESFAINSAGQITVNGVIDTTSSNVVVLAYVNHLVWQKNAAGNWYSKAISTAAWAGPTTTSPLPPETLAISAIGPQTVGVAFAINGTIGNALIAPTLQYSVSSGPWTNFPAGSTITTTTFSVTIPGIASAGPATVAVRDAGTPTITATSGTFTVSAAPVEQLAFAAIPAQLTNVPFRVTGTIANAQTIPTLQYNVNGGAWNALPSGSPASLVTQTAFAFTVPGIATPGTTTIGIRDANATSITAQSNSFQVGTPVGETLTIGTILGQLANQPFVVGGAIGNASIIPTLQYSVNGGTWLAFPSTGSNVTLTSFTLTVPGQNAGSATISVRDANATSVTATSNTFQIAPAGAEALTVNPIGVQAVGNPFAVSGTIVNVTTPPALQYSDNGGAWQPLPAGASVTTTGFSFLHPGLGATQSMTVAVRDANRTTVSAAAQPFPVIARESPNLTVVTTVGPQIVDSQGNTWALNASSQVLLNGVAQSATSNVIEVAYVNRQVWYENSNLQWWVFSSTGTWSPTGGTALGPLPSSKANIYLTKTARLAVVAGFTVAVPGIVINDTVVAGTFNLAIKSTNGTVSMPGASGSGTSSLTQSATLAVINQSLSGLLYTGKTIGNGIVTITVKDPAQSVATAIVNITVVRAAPVIPPGSK